MSAPARQPETDLFENVKVPANVAPYVNVLGHELAAEFFLTFGGSEVYLAKSPTPRSATAQLIGVERLRSLGEAFDFVPVAVPTAKPFVAEIMLRQGKGIAEIARTLHMDQSRVRRWLGPKPVSRQLSLFNDS